MSPTRIGLDFDQDSDGCPLVTLTVWYRTQDGYSWKAGLRTRLAIDFSMTAFQALGQWVNATTEKIFVDPEAFLVPECHDIPFCPVARPGSATV